METEVQMKGRVETCASRSTNGKGWATARDGGASRDEGCGMSRRSKWPLHLEDRAMGGTESKVGREMEEKETKRQVAHEVDRIKEEKVHNDKT